MICTRFAGKISPNKPQGFQFSLRCPSLVIGGGRITRVRDMCSFPYGSLVVYPPDVLFQAFPARWKICYINSTWWSHQHVAHLVTQLTNLEITELVYTLKSEPSIQGTCETFELIEKLYWDVPWLSECSKHLNIPWHLRQLLQWLDFPLALKCTGLDLFNDDTRPSGHISRPTEVNVSQSCFHSLNNYSNLIILYTSRG